MKKPNIVLCMVDQLRAFETGCYGNEVIRTPNIDRLAREGMRFETAVSTCPVCMPARSSVLTGQFARTCTGRLGNYAEKNAEGKWVLPEYPSPERFEMLDPTLPEILRGQGYDTALIGKWHIEPAPPTVGFDYSLYPRVHHRHTHQIFVENAGEGEEVDGWSVEYEISRVEQYLAEKREKPFFLFYNISPPHMPLLDAPEKYLTMYSPEEVPLRPNVFHEGSFPPLDADLERWFKIYLWDFLFYDYKMPHTENLPEGFDLRKLTALYYGLTTWTDDMVGRLMAALKANNLSEDTIVVFLSDHGDHLGSHGLYNKGTLFEESIRIPFIINAPGLIAPGVNHQQVAQIVDVMPTLLDLCGMPIPAHMQGRNLAPILRGEREVLEESWGFIEEAGHSQIGVRTATHLYGLQLRGMERAPEEKPCCFYNLADDPYEFRNLADPDAAPSGKDRDIAQDLDRKLREWNDRTPWFQRAGQ